MPIFDIAYKNIVEDRKKTKQINGFSLLCPSQKTMRIYFSQQNI